MNVLSVFDGIAGARIAFDRVGIKIKNFFSSEIDASAIKVAEENYKNIIQLGDIKDIKSKNLPRIDLLIGGSPCQDLSNAQKGEGLKGSRSRLFFEFIRLLIELKPRYFILENVKNKWGSMMSKIIGCPFEEINSCYFSAQYRPRYYWTNIETKDIISKSRFMNNQKIKNILEKNADRKYSLAQEKISKILELVEIKNINKSDGIIKLFDIPRNIHKDMERQRRVYSINGKTPTLLARADTAKIYIQNENTIRKLTPLECERAQTLPDYYTLSASDTKRYKMIGNGFTVNVIASILDNIKKPLKKIYHIEKHFDNIEEYLDYYNKKQQLQLFENN